MRKSDQQNIYFQWKSSTFSDLYKIQINRWKTALEWCLCAHPTIISGFNNSFDFNIFRLTGKIIESFLIQCDVAAWVWDASMAFNWTFCLLLQFFKETYEIFFYVVCVKKSDVIEGVSKEDFTSFCLKVLKEKIFCQVENDKKKRE